MVCQTTKTWHQSIVWYFLIILTYFFCFWSNFTPGNQIGESGAAVQSRKSRYWNKASQWNWQCYCKIRFNKFVKKNGYVYVPDDIDTEWLIRFSCDGIALLNATMDSKLFILHCSEMMAWQRSSDNSLTERLVQQSNRPAKLDQVLIRFHKLE